MPRGARTGSGGDDAGGESATVASAAIGDRLGFIADRADTRLVREVRRKGTLCREYVRAVMIDGHATRATATVCRDRGGEWQLAAAPPASSGSSRAAAVADSPYCPRPGTVVETSLGGYFRFTHGDGPRCWYRTGEDRLEARYAAFLSGDSRWLEMGGMRLAELFPLASGKEVWFTVTGATAPGFPSSWYETYTVRGRERVTVPAGTFDTWVVTWWEQGRLGNDYGATHTFWYAPSVGYFVRFRAGNHLSDSLQDWDATRVVLPEAPALASAGSRAPSGKSDRPRMRKVGTSHR